VPPLSSSSVCPCMNTLFRTLFDYSLPLHYLSFSPCTLRLIIETI
jgi:phosphatidate phosphatase APP1